MNYVRTLGALLLFTALTLYPSSTPVSAEEKIVREIQINPAGKVFIRGAKVVQVAGNSFFTRVEWDDISLKVLLRTDTTTKILKKYSGTAIASDIKEGHYLDIEGTLNTSADNLDIVGTVVRDLSLQTDGATFSGTIQKVGSGSATLKTATGEIITLSIGPETKISKGTLQLTPELVQPGNKALRAVGVYSFQTKTLATAELILERDSALYKPQIFEGVFRSSATTTREINLVVEIGKVPFTVFFTEKTAILNRARTKTSFNRFVPGDTVRIYGTRRESLTPQIDAEIIRNTNI